MQRSAATQETNLGFSTRTNILAFSSNPNCFWAWIELTVLSIVLKIASLMDEKALNAKSVAVPDWFLFRGTISARFSSEIKSTFFHRKSDLKNRSRAPWFRNLTHSRWIDWDGKEYTGRKGQGFERLSKLPDICSGASYLIRPQDERASLDIHFYKAVAVLKSSHLTLTSIFIRMSTLLPFYTSNRIKMTSTMIRYMIRLAMIPSESQHPVT